MPKCKSPRPPLLIRFMAEHFSEDCMHLRRVDEMRLSDIAAGAQRRLAAQDSWTASLNSLSSAVEP